MPLDARRCGRDDARMHTEDIDYGFEGMHLRGFLARDDAGEGSGRGGAAKPGVLVIHDAGGLSENIKEKARRLAKLGYVAFALDYFGEGKTVADGIQRIGPLAADVARWRGILRSGLEQLASRADASRLAAIGYCFGGTSVYELARAGAPLLAAVGFHSGLTPSSGEAKNIRGKVLCCIGADDPLIKPEARVVWENEMRGAGVDYQINLYGNTGHSFTNVNAPDRPGFAYQASSDARSWAEMRRLFDEVFAPGAK